MPNTPSTSVAAATAVTHRGTRTPGRLKGRLTGRSATTMSSSPYVRAADVASSRSSSSSVLSRPSTVACRRRSATCSRSASEARIDGTLATALSVPHGACGLALIVDWAYSRPRRGSALVKRWREGFWCHDVLRRDYGFFRCWCSASPGGCSRRRAQTRSHRARRGKGFSRPC